MQEYLEALRQDIPIGRGNSIRRKELSRLWRCDEREVRRLIAAMRSEPTQDKYVVLSASSTPAGYWRSDDPAEIRAFVVEMSARARHTFLALRHAKKILGVTEGRKA